MSLSDLPIDEPPSFGRDRAFINQVDDVFPECWYEGDARPYQFLSVIEQYLNMNGPNAGTRYRRARLDVARVYDVTERTISRACEEIYEEAGRDRFVSDLRTFEEQLKDE